MTIVPITLIIIFNRLLFLLLLMLACYLCASFHCLCFFGFFFHTREIGEEGLSGCCPESSISCGLFYFSQHYKVLLTKENFLGVR